MMNILNWIIQNNIRKIIVKTPNKYTDEAFLSKVYELAYDGFYNVEIACELQIGEEAFKKAVSRNPKLKQTLESARENAINDGAGMPSPAKFRDVWNECKGRRSELIKKFRIGYKKFKQWLADDPRLADIIAQSELEFLEKLDARGRMLALGMTNKEAKESDFKGWKFLPDANMIRYYLNTKGRRYGYGENPTEDFIQDGEVKVNSGIDISMWIEKELMTKGNIENPNKEF